MPAVLESDYMTRVWRHPDYDLPMRCTGQYYSSAYKIRAMTKLRGVKKR